MEKYSQITNHLRNGTQLDANFKVSSIVDSKGSPNKVNHAAPGNSHVYSSHGQGGSRSTAKHSIISDLIPYPSSAISTTIEKANVSTTTNNFESIPNNHTMAPSVVRQSSLETSKRMSLTEKLQNANQQEQPGSSPSHSVNSITDASSQSHQVCDEKTVSFDSNDIIRIVKLLQEKKENSTQTECNETCNQYVQVSSTESGADMATTGTGSTNSSIDLNRSNQTLKSQLDQLSYIIEEMSKERSSTNLQLHSLQKTIKVRELKIEELHIEKEKCLADNDELRFAMKNMETLIGDYQKSLQTKCAESDALRQELSASTSQQSGLLSQLEQTQGQLRTKEELVAEMYRVSALHQEEIVALKGHCQTMAQHMAQSNAEMQHLQAYRLRLEQQLASSLQAAGAQGPEVAPAAIIKKPLGASALTLHLKCTEMRQSLRALKEAFLVEYQQNIAVWNERKADILRKLASTLADSKVHNRTTTETMIKSYEETIEHLKAANEKILHDAAQYSEQVRTVNGQLGEKLSTLQLHNGTLKEANEAYQEKIVNLNEECVKLREQSRLKEAELEQCRRQMDAVEGQLNSAQLQLSTLARSKETESSNVVELTADNRELRGVIEKLEEERSVLKSRLEELNIQWEETSTYKAQLSTTQAQLEQSQTELEHENKIKQQIAIDVEQLRVELKGRKEKIVNLESNIQMLTKKYREVSVQLNSKAPLLEQACQTTETGAEMEEAHNNLQQLKAALIERDSSIRDQNDHLLKLTGEYEQTRNERQEMQNQVNRLEECLREKDLLLQKTPPQAEPSPQLIVDIKADLVKERERSKGLSQSLFNEKRLNSKLKKELSRLKQPKDQEATITITKTETCQKTTEDSPTDLSRLDLPQLRSMLKDKVAQLKELSSLIEIYKMENGPESEQEADETDHSTDIPQSSAICLPPGVLQEPLGGDIGPSGSESK